MNSLALVVVMSLAHPWVSYELTSTNDVREHFINAASTVELREDYLKSLQSYELGNETFHDAYLGAAMTLYAECEFTPWSKYSYFKDGTKLIESAIAQAPSNAEFRYLRFLIQSQSPVFLNYSSKIDEDYQILRQHIRSNKHTDSPWISFLNSYLEDILKDKRYPAIKLHFHGS